jgi:putative peptidoglycan lipid II flippase
VFHGDPARQVVSVRRGLVTAGTLILLGNLASRLLGMVREQVIAALFGDTAVASAFGTASTVPTIFYDLVIGGAVSAALIPVLSGYAKSGDDTELSEVVSTLLIGAAMILGILVIVLTALAGPLTTALGVGPDLPIRDTTVGFVRIVAPALLFLGMSGVAGAVCYARGRVIFPAFAIALFNVGLVGSALLLHVRLGATSLVLGVLLGAALQFLGVLPGLSGIKFQLRFRPNHPAVRQILRLYAPVAAGLVVSGVGVLIDRNLAWQTGEASVATMRYATTLVQLPLGLVGTATSLAALPLLSRMIDDNGAFRQTLASGLRLALVAIVPAAAFLAIFIVPTVRLIYERGAFDAQATDATASAFLLYAPQLPFVAIDQLLVYSYYARKNTVTPMLVGLGGVVVYLSTALLLIGPGHLGLGGLILANTIQNSLHAIALFWLLSRSVGSLRGFGIWSTLGRATAAGLTVAAIGFGLSQIVPAPLGVLKLLGYLAVAGGLSLAVYIVVLGRLGVEEVMLLGGLLRGRLRRKPNSAAI